MTTFIRKILFPISILTCAFLIILRIISSPEKDITDYTLKSYKNTVALYNGEKIIEVYSNIVLNTLPEKDIQTFKNGLPFSSPSQARSYLEDFE